MEYCTWLFIFIEEGRNEEDKNREDFFFPMYDLDEF